MDSRFCMDLKTLVNRDGKLYIILDELGDIPSILIVSNARPGSYASEQW